MLIKAGVKAAGVKPELLLGLSVAETIYRKLTGEYLVVTSLTDGKHKAASLHYKGLAADLRTHDLNTAQRQEFYLRLRDALGPDFDVIFEDEGKPNEHIHLEYDPA